MRKLLASLWTGLVLLCAVPAAAALSNPTVVGTASTASGGTQNLDVTVPGGLADGDIILILSASNSSISATGRCVTEPGDSECTVPIASGTTTTGTQSSSTMRTGYYYIVVPPGGFGGTAPVFRTSFASTASAKSMIVLKLSGGTITGRVSASAIGSSTTPAFSISGGTLPAGNSMVIAMTGVLAGAPDSYTDDASWTTLSSTGGGTYPEIRVAYVLSTSSGALTHTITDNTSSRSWVDGWNAFPEAGGTTVTPRLLLLGVGQ